MNEIEKYFYTYTNAALAVCLDKSEIANITKCDETSAWINLKNGERINFPKKMAKQAHVQARMERARGLKAYQNIKGSAVFRVDNPEKKTSNIVICHIDCITCSCEDWKKQNEILQTNRVACKHVYAVLKAKNLNSLGDWLAATEQARQLLK